MSDFCPRNGLFSFFFSETLHYISLKLYQNLPLLLLENDGLYFCQKVLFFCLSDFNIKNWHFIIFLRNLLLHLFELLPEHGIFYSPSFSFDNNVFWVLKKKSNGSAWVSFLWKLLPFIFCGILSSGLFKTLPEHN